MICLNLNMENNEECEFVPNYYETLVNESVRDKIILTSILYREHKKGDRRIMELVKKVNGAKVLYEYEDFHKAAKYLTK